MCVTSLEGRTSLQTRTMPGGVGDGGRGSRGPSPSPFPSPFPSPVLSVSPRQTVFARSPLPGAKHDDCEVVWVVEEGDAGSRLQETAAAAVASRNLVTSFIPSLRRRLTLSFFAPPGREGRGAPAVRNGQSDI